MSQGFGLYGPRLGGVHIGHVYFDLYGRAGTYYPIVHGAIPYGWARSCAGYIVPRRLSFRFTLPHVPFMTGYRLRRIGGLRAYSAVQAFYRWALAREDA